MVTINLTYPEDEVYLMSLSSQYDNWLQRGEKKWYARLESTICTDRRWGQAYGASPQEAIDNALALLRADIDRRGKALYNRVSVGNSLDLDLDLSGL